YHHVRAGTDLGAGDDVWTRACAGIRSWAAHRGAGITVMPAETPTIERQNVAVITSAGPLHVLAACRIVRVIDEPDRFGFAYGTLPSHPVEGEEHFVVTRDADSTRSGGAVRFDVAAFSRPHDLLTRLGGPLPRRLQARAPPHSLHGMREHVG